ALEIDFTASFGTTVTGLYKVERDGDSYAFTVFEPADARQAFPCWDEPAFKIPFQLTATIPEEYLAISNTPEESSSVVEGLRTVKFRKTPPLPSYGVAISVGPFETVPIDGLRVPGRIVTARGNSRLAAIAAAATPPILRRLEAYFEHPYPYAKLDLIAVPDFPSGALENPAAVVFSEDVLLLDADSVSAADRGRQAIVVAHEIAHMWFGNLVTLTWWDDIWLNEAFATWMGLKVAEQAFPELGAGIRGLRQAQQAMELDARASATPIRRQVADPDEAFTVGGALTYDKGAAVLGMFERWVGAERFRTGVNAYVKAHAWGNATGADFWQALDAASEKQVSTAIATFLDQPGFPLIEVELRGGRLELRQQPFTDRGEAQTWSVPVTLKLPRDGGHRTETFMLAESARGEALAGPEGEPLSPEWIFPNAGAAGYYRWTMPAEPLRALAGKAVEVLDPRERLDLLSNAGALLTTGALAGDAYLDLLSAFAGDPDPAVIGALTSALSDVDGTYVTPALEEPFAAYVRRTLKPALARFGVEPSADEDEAVASARGNLYLLLGRDGVDADIRRHARAAVRTFLAGGKIAPELIRPVLRVAALDGDGELFDAYLKRFAAASNPTDRSHLAAGMGSFATPELRARGLDQILAGSLQLNELMLLAMTVLSDAEGADQLYRWIKTNYDALTERMPPMFEPFMPRFTGGCSAERLADAEVFFAQPEHRAPGTESQMAQVAEQVRDCVRLRARESAAIGGYLRPSPAGNP
ncbi:MAG: M1 family aminopeptidase, partial [Thermoanaerobaculia bacterium]